MKLTIGMASYNNFDEVWFTVQALRLYQDLSDCEILIIDNFGDQNIKNFVNGWLGEQVRFIEYKENQGTAAAKNRVFAEAKGEWVLCMDSHVMLRPRSITKLKHWISKNNECKDLIQGPLVYDNLVSGADSFSTVWSDGMWGQWNNIHTDRTIEPYEIPMMGMGMFCCRKDAWLGFNTEFKGFGGEEGYIHEKYRKYGQKTLCLPWLEWLHYFRPAGKAPYIVTHEDKLRNYVIGFEELGLDLSPLNEHFGKDNVDKFAGQYVSLDPEKFYTDILREAIDIKEHMPTLSRFAKDKRVVELGVRNGDSTIALVWGKPSSLTSYDINPCPRERQIKDMAQKLGITISILIGDSREVEIGETDVLFIDTFHTERQLSIELEKHASSVKERIIMHDTAAYGTTGEDGTGGLNMAIYKFLMLHPEWIIERVFTNNNGLTIMKRV